MGSGAKTRYFLDNVEVPREEFDRRMDEERSKLPQIGGGGCCLSSTPPIVSDALAVHPRQAEEAREDAKRRGVPTEFQADGRPKFTSRQHLQSYCRAYNFFNRDEVYSPKNV